VLCMEGSMLTDQILPFPLNPRHPFQTLRS
jgi:hypothetical protein